MPKVRITPNSTFHPGHIGSLLAQVAPGPMAMESDGSVTVKMTDAQLDEFTRRGGAAHRVEILPESDPPSAVAGIAPAAEPDTAGPAIHIHETTKSTNEEYRREVLSTEPTADRYVAQCRERGMTDQEIIDTLVRAGWKESQAIDVVMNDAPPAA